MATLEAILLRLKEQGLGLRAAELAEVMISTHRVSKRALYLALAATHAAGLCLQSAPLQRALSTDFNVRSTGAKKMLQALETEFDGNLETADYPASDPAEGRVSHRDPAAVRGASRVSCRGRVGCVVSALELAQSPLKVIVF